LEGADYADSDSTKESKGSHEKGILLIYDQRTSNCLIEMMYDKDVKCVYWGKISKIQIFPSKIINVRHKRRSGRHILTPQKIYKIKNKNILFYFMARSKIPFQSLFKFDVLKGADYADSGLRKESKGSHEKGILVFNVKYK
jgi:hypothetical protein